MNLRVVSIFAAVAAFFAFEACQSTGAEQSVAPMAKAKAPYSIRGDEVEGCECQSVCPCVFAHDVTFGDCRGTIVWHVVEGAYGNTDLSGISFAVVLTKTGKNVVKAMGSWEGLIYVADKATPQQKDAIVDILSSNWGKAFSKIAVKSAPIEFRKNGDEREVTIGKVAVLKTTPLPGSDGKAPSIENAPFKLIPKVYCAVTSVNTYNDGSAATWDFKGRNSFYGPFDYRGE